jgi:hypothetical protein
MAQMNTDTCAMWASLNIEGHSNQLCPSVKSVARIFIPVKVGNFCPLKGHAEFFFFSRLG